MGLTQTLATSLSGLRATQASLSIVAGNIANAQTAGYIARSLTQVETPSSDGSSGVRVSSINRLLDTFVQKKLWTESAGGGYANIKANFYQQLLQVYGQPGSDNSLDSVFNNFTNAVQALSTSPNSSVAQDQTISTAQAMAQQLNNTTNSIQMLRAQADQGIANDVQQANNAMQQIANINHQLGSAAIDDGTTATLEDQRDQYISQLSNLMDIRVSHDGDNQVTIFTSSGAQLVGAQASQLSFDQAGTIAATQQWNADPTKSGLGTITLTSASGSTTDLIATGGIQSGEIAGYLNMRDGVLVQAQDQIDQIAAQMSQALSDTTTAGAPVAGGFDADISGLSNGNTIKVSYTDVSNVQHNITIVRVDDPSALPLPNSATTDPNDTVIGVDFSGGPAAAATALNTALGSIGLQFSNPSGNLLEVVDSGSPAITVNAVSTTATETTFNGGVGALPLFTDGANLYTGAYTGDGAESTGYAGRITVNSGLVSDPSLLVNYQVSTPAGDATRPNFIYNQLVNTPLNFSPAAGIGGTTPFHGSLSDYLSQIISTQSIAANSATSLQSGQQVVVNALQARFDSTSSVNIDTEMANLLTLQNSYGANARVMSTVKAMLDALLQM